MFRLSPIKLWRNISVIIFLTAICFTLVGTFFIHGDLAVHWNDAGVPNNSSGKWILNDETVEVLAGLAALAAAFTACEDNMITGEIDYPVENLSRLFAPVEFKEVKPMPDGFRIQWTPVDGAQGYIFQFCADSLFNEGSDEYYAGHPNASRVVLSDTLVTTATVDTITGLGLEQEYFIRMAAFAQGKADIKFDNYLRYSQAIAAVRPLMEDLNILGEYEAAL